MCELSSNVYKNLKHLVNALKANKTICQNNQIITACDIKVYWCEMTMNKKSTMIGLIINSSVIILKEYLIIVLSCYLKL